MQNAPCPARQTHRAGHRATPELPTQGTMSPRPTDPAAAVERSSTRRPRTCRDRAGAALAAHSSQLACPSYPAPLSRRSGPLSPGRWSASAVPPGRRSGSRSDSTTPMLPTSIHLLWNPCIHPFRSARVAPAGTPSDREQHSRIRILVWPIALARGSGLQGWIRTTKSDPVPGIDPIWRIATRRLYRLRLPRD